MLTLARCLSVAHGAEARGLYKLEALDLWISERREATVSVGIVTPDDRRCCTLAVHGQTFSATSSSGGFEGTWSAILLAVDIAEAYERESGLDSDEEPVTLTPDELVRYLDRMGLRAS
jgi:hypothetical protein